MSKTVTIKFDKFTPSELLQFWLGLDHERQILEARGLTICESLDETAEKNFDLLARFATECGFEFCATCGHFVESSYILHGQSCVECLL